MTRAILLALLLSGCATAQPQVRLVTVPCVAKEQVLPAEPPRVHAKLTGQADIDLNTVAASALRLRAWGESLMGIVEGCRALDAAK